MSNKTREKTRYPGITKITTEKGAVSYRLIVDVGPSATRKRNQECWTYRTLKEATDKRSQVLADRKANTLVKRSDVTFDQLCERWLASKHDVREVTRIGYADHLKIARAQLGRIKVQDIARSDVERVVRAVQDRGLSHRSVVVTLGRIKQVLGYGISEGVVAVNVASSVKPPRKQHSTAPADTRPKDEPWDQDEFDLFRAVADQDEWAAAWRLTLCGLRRSEVMGMTWDAIDPDRGEVQIIQGRVLLDGHRTAIDDPKSAASRRTVSIEDILPGTVALFRALSARQAADKLGMGPDYLETGLVLVDALGRPIRPDTYSDRYSRLCREAGVRPIHPHLVRHALANKMNRAGVAIVDAAALLGHTPQVYMSTYLRPTEQGVRSAASALGAALAGGGVYLP
jgi:integrase